MGAYLSEPNVEKISEDGGSERLSYGVSAMQGWRVAMEVSMRAMACTVHRMHCPHADAVESSYLRDQ